jgi:hypothetical protein
MPVGKELGTYSGAFNYVKYADDGSVEGSYTAKVTGDLAGTATGTMTFVGGTDRGVCADRGAGYLTAGDVVPYHGQGAYWSTSQGHWEVRIAFMVGENRVVSEGQITMKDGVFSLTGTLSELS